MSNKDFAPYFWACFASLMSFVVGVTAGELTTTHRLQRDAIAKGVAEWSIDNNSNLVFTYKAE